MATSFGPMVHSELVEAGEKSAGNRPTRELGKGFASARTAVNVHTTMLGRVLFGPTAVALCLLGLLLRRIDRLQQRLRSQRTRVVAWLTDPDTVEAGREQHLERQLRSTEAATGTNLHPRYGLLGAISGILLFIRFPLYVVHIGFDAPYVFSFFLQAFDAPTTPEPIEYVTNPQVISALLIALIPTLLVAVLIEFAAHPLASLLHQDSRKHARRHALTDVIAALVALGGLTGLLYLIARSRFAAASGFQAMPGGQHVAALIVTLLPWFVLVVAMLAHNPRLVEARQRRRFARRLNRLEKRATRREARWLAALSRNLDAVSTRLHLIQARLDVIGSVADQQVTWEALQSGVYGVEAPEWQRGRVLGPDPAPATVAPTLGVPTTMVAYVAPYPVPPLADILDRDNLLRRSAQDLRGITAVFDAFRADPSQFLLVPTPAVDGRQGEKITPEQVRARLNSLGEVLLPEDVLLPERVDDDPEAEPSVAAGRPDSTPGHVTMLHNGESAGTVTPA